MLNEQPKISDLTTADLISLIIQRNEKNKRNMRDLEKRIKELEEENAALREQLNR